MVVIISFINMKGGVGKTTISSLIGEILSSEYGRKTLLIDLDPQINSTLTFIHEDEWKDKDDKNLTISQLFQDYIDKTYKFDFDKSIFKKVNKIREPKGTLDLLPSSPILSLIQERLYNYINNPQGRIPPDLILKENISEYLNNYSFVLLDAPPNIGIISRNGLKISNYFVIPVIPDYLSTYGINELLYQLNNYYKINIPLLGIIINKYKHTKTHDSIIESLTAKEKYKNGPHIFNHRIRETIKLSDFPQHHDSYKGFTPGQLFGYGENSIYEDIMSLTEEIITEVEKYE
jgi:chromosome partitioning protein